MLSAVSPSATNDHVGTALRLAKVMAMRANAANAAMAGVAVEVKLDAAGN